MSIENTARTINVIPATKVFNSKGKGLAKNKVCAYARVSTDSEDQLNSYNTQCEYYETMLSQDPSIEYVGLYADEGVTGTKMRKRKDFLRMIEDCRAGKITRIVTKSVQRFARNTVECLNIARELNDKGITIKFETNGIDTADPGSWLILSIMATLAEEESRTISHNITWSYQKKFQRGEYAGGGKIYGYEIKGNEFKIVPEQAMVVKRLFTEFARGRTLRAIQKDLERDHIPSPRGKSTWLHSTIKSILMNEKYKGDLLLQKTFKSDVLCDRRQNTGERQQFQVKRNHLPIVDESLFDAVQQELGNRCSTTKEEVGLSNYSYDYAFSTIVECGECGAKFRRHSQWSLDKSKKVPIWVCTKHQKEKDKCSMKPIKEETLEQGFMDALNQIVSRKQEVLAMVSNNIEKVINKPQESTIPALLQALEDKQKKLLEISTSIASKPTQEQSIESANLIHDIKDLQDKIEIAKKNTDRISVLDYRFKEVKQLLTGTYTEFNKHICKALLEKVIIKDKHHATYLFKCGIAIEQEI